jgi:hypothetical protein
LTWFKYHVHSGSTIKVHEHSEGPRVDSLNFLPDVSPQAVSGVSGIRADVSACRAVVLSAMFEKASPGYRIPGVVANGLNNTRKFSIGLRRSAMQFQWPLRFVGDRCGFTAFVIGLVVTGMAHAGDSPPIDQTESVGPNSSVQLLQSIPRLEPHVVPATLSVEVVPETVTDVEAQEIDNEADNTAVHAVNPTR